VPYDELMASSVYAPAGMIHTGPDHHYAIVPGRARPYLLLTEREHQALPPAARALARAGEVYNANFHDTSMKRAAGGLLSTAEDLVRFALALQAGRIVRPGTVEAMWNPQTTRAGEPLDTPWGPMGIGWFVRRTGDRREIYSSGGQVGGRSSLYLLPDDGIALALMTNLTEADLVPLERELLGILVPGYAAWARPAAAGGDEE
jgi:CubicO group peptidase (beta-lactamase class C family)